MDHTFRVEAEFDHEAGVWYVSDSDVPGLSTEAPSLDELMAKLQVMIPDLLDAQAELGMKIVRPREGDVSIDFIAHVGRSTLLHEWLHSRAQENTFRGRMQLLSPRQG